MPPSLRQWARPLLRAVHPDLFHDARRFTPAVRDTNAKSLIHHISKCDGNASPLIITPRATITQVAHKTDTACARNTRARIWSHLVVFVCCI